MVIGIAAVTGVPTILSSGNWIVGMADEGLQSVLRPGINFCICPSATYYTLIVI